MQWIRLNFRPSAKGHGCARKSRLAVLGVLAQTVCCSGAVSLTADVQCHCQMTQAELAALMSTWGLPSSATTAGPIREAYPDLDDHAFGLLQQYWDCGSQLRDLYGTLQLRGRMTRQIVQQGSTIDEKTPMETARFTYFASGGRQFRLDLDWTGIADKNYGITAVLAPDEQWMLQTDQHTNRRFLKLQGNNLNAAFHQFCTYSPHHLAYTDEDNYPLLRTVFFHCGRPIEGRITAVTETQNPDGEQIVILTWSNSRGPGTKRIELLPGRSWALKRYTCEATFTGSQYSYAFRNTIDCDYSGGPTDPALLKRCVRQRYWSDQPDFASMTLCRHEVIEIDEVSPEMPGRDVFNVYKLLGRGQPLPTQPAVQYWWILFLNGFALFLIGAYLLRRRQHDKSRTQASSSAATDPAPPASGS